MGVTEGVFILPKKPAAVIAAGGRVSWDNTAHQCDAPGAGLYPVGVAVEAAGNGASTAAVIASVTPTPKDDEWVAKVRKLLDLLAFNIGNARNR
ncbi:capsid cement protein [Azospirillum argentinense]